MTYAKLFLNTGSSIPDRERGIRDFIDLTGPLGMTMENQLRRYNVVRAVVWHMPFLGATANIYLTETLFETKHLKWRNFYVDLEIRPSVPPFKPVCSTINGGERVSDEERDETWARLFTECDAMFQRNRPDTIGFNIIDIEGSEDEGTE